MSTIKMQQAYLSDLKKSILIAADYSDTAATAVTSAIGGLSRMEFSGQAVTIDELSSLRKRLSKLYQDGTSYCKLITEYSDNMQAIDDSLNESSEAIIGISKIDTSNTDKSSFSFSAAAKITTQTITAALFIANPVLSGITKVATAITQKVTGWFKKLFSEKNSNSVNAEKGTGKIINAATEQLGKPYVGGGDGPNVYDCIGLVREAYRAQGINLPRATNGNGTPTWAEQGIVKDVTGQSDAPKPGDILCWYYNVNNKSGQPNHVAIYTGHIKTDIINGKYNGYKTDSEGYIVDKYNRRIDCINALDSYTGVCYIAANTFYTGPPTDVWRAP